MIKYEEYKRINQKVKACGYNINKMLFEEKINDNDTYNKSLYTTLACYFTAYQIMLTEKHSEAKSGNQIMIDAYLNLSNILNRN